MYELKGHYSAQELVNLKLNNLPKTKKAIIDKAKREFWQYRNKVGRGGGLEYELASLPQEIQDEIRSKFAVAVVNKKPSLPAVK